MRGPFNCVPSGSQAAAFFAMRALTDPTIPTNGGCFRPVRLVLPSGSIVNPDEPAPVNARTSTIKRITTAIWRALRQAMPDRVPAVAASELMLLAFGGRHADGRPLRRRRDRRRRQRRERRCSDGVDVIETDATNSMNLPVEAIEIDAPLRMRRYRAAPRFRRRRRASAAASACVREYEVLDGEITFTHRGERHYCPHAASPAAATARRRAR